MAMNAALSERNRAMNLVLDAISYVPGSVTEAYTTYYARLPGYQNGHGTEVGKFQGGDKRKRGRVE